MCADINTTTFPTRSSLDHASSTPASMDHYINNKQYHHCDEYDHRQQQQQQEPQEQKGEDPHYQQQEQQDSATTTTSRLLCNIMAKAGGSDGLKHLSQSMLRQLFEPVLKILEELDAETLLQLERVPMGARLCDGIDVRPIHNSISPHYGTNVGSYVRYLHVAEVPDQYTIGIFIFPPFSKIPLHDHPGMCVLSRLLYGDLQCLALDFVRDDDNDDDTTTRNQKKRKQQRPSTRPFGSRKALKNEVAHLHAPAVTMTFPYERNLHEFFAGPQGAAVLDILLPPYDDDGKDCTFYDIHVDSDNDGNYEKQQSSSTNNNDGADVLMESNTIDNRECWVYPIDKPTDYECLGGTYGNFV